MRKVVAAMNMTIDGFCDHDVMLADDEIHDHYTELLQKGGVMLYGRITYQLMEDYWPELVKHPGDDKPMNDFAVAIDTIPKIVFSKTLTATSWDTARLSHTTPEEEIKLLKQPAGGDNKDILIGSPGLIAAMHKLKLIDEYQLCIHPVVAGKGLPLFKDVTERTELKLMKTKVFKGGAVLMYYERGAGT